MKINDLSDEQVVMIKIAKRVGDVVVQRAREKGHEQTNVCLCFVGAD